MTFMLARHKVEDFGKWKGVFDSLADLRKRKGETSAQLFRDTADPNSLTLLFGWDSLENAQGYAQSPELREAMGKAGVTGPPEITFLAAE